MFKRLFKPWYIWAVGVFFCVNGLQFEVGAYKENSAIGPKSVVAPSTNDKNTDRKIKEAYETTQSDFWVQSQGQVIKLLKDDNDGARHQRFLLRLSNGHSILIAHNLDVAARIPNLKPGDVVRFFGEYEWNNKGGVVHWTHHDPSGRKAGGWLEYNGRRYE